MDIKLKLIKSSFKTTSTPFNHTNDISGTNVSLSLDIRAFELSVSFSQMFLLEAYIEMTYFWHQLNMTLKKTYSDWRGVSVSCSCRVSKSVVSSRGNTAHNYQGIILTPSFGLHRYLYSSTHIHTYRHRI